MKSKRVLFIDVLRDLCIKKADELNFLNQIPNYQRYVFIHQTRVTEEFMENSNEDEKNFFRQVPTYLKRVSEFKSPTTRTLHRIHSGQVIMYFQIQIHSGSNIYKLGISIPVSVNRMHAEAFRKTSYNVQTLLCCNGSGNSFAKIWYPFDYLFLMLSGDSNFSG